MFTKYKLQKLKTKQILHQTILKLQNSHSKIHSSAGTMFCEAKGQQEQWRRVSSTRRRTKRWKKQGSATASSPFPVLAGVTCKTPKNATGSRF